ncbi:MAG: hypothetical protein PHX80_03910 [Candidatus Nanoarchaeia archaeon]|nr:hypothetical protein [Candidatus Nanoarchaeia archaeon]
MAAESIVKQFFNLIDAHYGMSLHHIGDGDGISKEDADEIRKLYASYALDSEYLDE